MKWFAPLLWMALLFAMPARAAGIYDLELVPVKPHIYLIRRPDALRQPVEGNVTVIVNEQDVVVVDGGGSPLAATNAIRLIRSLTDKPVSPLDNPTRTPLFDSWWVQPITRSAWLEARGEPIVQSGTGSNN